MQYDFESRLIGVYKDREHIPVHHVFTIHMPCVHDIPGVAVMAQGLQLHCALRIVYVVSTIFDAHDRDKERVFQLHRDRLAGQ